MIYLLANGDESGSESVSQVRLFVTPWTVAHQAPLSMKFSRQEYWSGLPCPSPGDLPNPGIEPGSPALQADYNLSHQGSPLLQGKLTYVGACLLCPQGQCSPARITPRPDTRQLDIQPE